MKKYYALLIAAGLVLAGCSTPKQDETPKETPAPAEETAVPEEPKVPEELAGMWYEEQTERGMLEISFDEEGNASAVIDWSSSAFEKAHWEMPLLSYSPETSTMDYMNGTLTILNFEKGDTPEERVEYDDGAGSFSITEKSLVWYDGHSETPDEPVTFVREEDVMTQIANPWTQTTDLDEAIDISGIWFMPPVMPPKDVEFESFYVMPGTLDAHYTNGTDTLLIRKSTEAEGHELSGDYTEYSKEWDVYIKGLKVTCRGDGTLMNEMIFNVDDTHWAVLFNAGEEGNGMDANELNSLINGMQ